MKLTVYAICKDEADALPIMLDSVKSIADEIVIADTGSTDNTIEVARRYTDKIIEIPWENSFAKARNRALDHCTGDWILSMDCDEVIEPDSAKGLKPFLSKLSPDVQLLLVTMKMMLEDGSPHQEFLAERIFRGNQGIRFEGDMHNWVDVPEGSARIAVPGIKLVHNRAVKSPEARAERARQRLEMAESIFLPKIDADPTDRRSLFYMAGTYFDARNIEKAAEYFEKYLLVSDWSHERYQSAYLLAQCYELLGNRTKAQETLGLCITENWRRAEAFGMLGRMALSAKDYDESKHWFQFASLLPLPVDPMFVEVPAHTWEPHHGLWETYKATGDTDKAVEHGRKAIGAGDPHKGAILKFEKNRTEYPDQRIVVLVDRGQMDFIQPAIDHWKCQGKEIRIVTGVEEVKTSHEWADVIFCEWVGELAVKVTELPKRGRVVFRIHGKELNFDHLTKINWLKVDDVIVVNQSLKENLLEVYPDIEHCCNVYVVPGGVEVDKFTIGDGKQGNKIAMLGYVNTRKNLPLALQILAAAPDKELHIAGDWQDDELLRYTIHIARELGIEDRLKVYGRIEDANEWFADKDFILSTSVRETFHYAIAEGMAAGLKPVVHNWQGVREFYEPQWVFNTVEEAVRMLSSPGNPNYWREYAMQNLGVDRNLRRIDRVMSKPCIAVAGEPSSPMANEYRFTKALDSLGCRTDAPDPDAVIILGTHPHLEPWMDQADKILWVDDKVGETERDQDGREWRQQIWAEVDLAISQNGHWVEALKREGAKRVEYIPIVGAVAPFRKLSGVEKEFDVGFLGHHTDFRDAKLESLSNEFGIHWLENCYDAEQVNLFFNKCKVVVSLHAYDDPRIEWRIAEAMAAGTCVVTERLPEGHPFPEDCLYEVDDLNAILSTLLNDDELRECVAANGYKWIWSRCRLEHRLEKVLEAVGL